MARVSYIALGFSIPIAVAMDGLLAALILIGWLLAARFRETAEAVRNNPVALMACLWLVAHALGAIYSIGDPAEVQRTVGKAAMFLLIPIGLTVLDSPRDRELALYAFMAAIALTTVISYLRWLGIIPNVAPLLKNARFSHGVVFKYHLTQSLLLAFGAFVFAIYANRVRQRRSRVVLSVLSGLAALNVLIVADGRTGQIVLLFLMLYYGAWRLGWKGFASGVATGLIAAIAVYAVPSSSVHKRAAAAISEASEWQPGVASGKVSAVGERLEFFRRSTHIVAAHPIIGVGSGGFIAAYADEVRGTELEPTHNPHNEYLLRAVELGVPGLLLLVALFWVVWRSAYHLPDKGHTAIARGLVITFAVASLATSTLNDHTESLLFIWTTGVLFSALRSASDRAVAKSVG
jgi:O-antigen ligase